MPSLVRNVARLQWLVDIRLTGLAKKYAAVSKVHDLITCESKVQIVVPLGS